MFAKTWNVHPRSLCCGVWEGMWFSLAAPNPIPSTININPGWMCKPCWQFLCLHTMYTHPPAPGRQKDLGAPVQWGRSASGKPTAVIFLKAFHTGNKLTVQTEVPGLWQLDSPAQNPSAAAALSHRFSCCTSVLPSQAFGTPNVATWGSWGFLGCE